MGGTTTDSSAALKKMSPSNAKATELSPLKLTGKFQFNSKRGSNQSSNDGKPFLETEYRVGDHKASTYKRNEEEYKKEIEDSLKMARISSPRSNTSREEAKDSPRLAQRKISANARLSPIRK